MTSQIRRVVKVSINEGQLDEFKEVANRFIERVKAGEPRTLNYDWFVDDESGQCCILERYENSEALLLHLANIRDLYEPLFEVCQIYSIEVFGNVTEEIRKAHISGTKFWNDWLGLGR